MNAQLLIDQVVRQTMVLIAQLATSGGARAPLAHVADRVFLDLAHELDAQGVSRKVSADMFGVALRSYRRRVQRLSESITEQGRSLWEALLDAIPRDRLLKRTELVARFQRDDSVQVGAILNDLCESGLVLRLGRGYSTAYRAVTTDELATLEKSADGIEHFIWLLIYREGPLSQEQLVGKLVGEAERVPAALRVLLADGRIQESAGAYHSHEVVLPPQANAGWEAAMLDHFQAVVCTLCSRLRGQGDAELNGGSTYSFDMRKNHPLAVDVYSTLKRFRTELSQLRMQVEQYNAAHPDVPSTEQVTVYAGQFIQEQEHAIDPSA